MTENNYINFKINANFNFLLSWSVVFFFSFLFSIASIFAQTDLVISQYIETNSGTSPKGIEVFNTTNSDIILSIGNNLNVFKGGNGGAFTSAVNITIGTIPANGVWVIGTTGLTNVNTVYGFTFNGNDALKIELGGIVQDIIGTEGVNPGTEWAGNGVSTKNQNIQIKDGFCDGNVSGWTDPSVRFTTVSIDPVNDMSGFGVAPASCTIATATAYFVDTTICSYDSLFLANSYQKVSGTYIDSLLAVDGSDSVINTTLIVQSQLIAGLASTNLYCNGNSSGDVTVSGTGGGSPYTYLWSNSTSLNYIGNLSAGSYQVTLTDTLGCVDFGLTTLTEPTAITVSMIAKPPSCFGYQDGEVTTVITGGSLAYTYYWNGGQTTQNISGLAAGNFVLTVTDASQCYKANSITLTEPPLFTVTLAVGNEDCNTGLAAINNSTTGGTTPYTYLWSNSASTQNISGLNSATYIITATDGGDPGCSFSRSIFVATVTPLSATIVATQLISCNGSSDGNLSASTTGGKSPFIYQWSNGTTGQNIGSLPAGTYICTVTDNGGQGCTKIATYTLINPILDILSFTNTDATCNGNNDGSATVMPSNTDTYSYLWNNTQTVANATGLVAGIYTVNVTNSSGCLTTGQATISQPSAISITFTETNNCSTGFANISSSVAGGGTSYSYLWNYNNETNTTISGLSTATYTLSVTDNKGCLNNKGINATAVFPISTNISTGNVSCFGQSDAAISVSPMGGTSPFVYSWSTGSSSNTINNLTAGVYILTFTDYSLCSIIENITVTEPVKELVTFVVTDALCNGEIPTSMSGAGTGTGAATATAIGATGPYTYLWGFSGGTSITQTANNLSGGVHYLDVVNSANPVCTYSYSVTVPEPTAITPNVVCSPSTGNNGSAISTPSGGTNSGYTYYWSNAKTTAGITGLSTGLYTATVTDANNCTVTDNCNVTATICNLITSTTVTDVSCTGLGDGAIQIQASSGIPPYSYVWNTSSTLSSLTGLGPGTYTVTISDNIGCTIIDQVTVTSGQYVLANFTGSGTPQCLTGNSYNFDASSSYSIPAVPLTYQWDFGDGTTGTGVSPTHSYTVTGGQTVILTVTAGICKDGMGAGHTIYEEPIININTKTNPSCFGLSDGEIILTVTSSLGLQNFIWNTGNSLTDSLLDISAGVYSVTATNGPGCTSFQSFTLTDPTPLTSSITCTPSSDSNGTVSINGIGGTTPYFYLWNTTETTSNLTYKPIGTYTTTVTDANNCTVTDNCSVIVAPCNLSITSNITKPTCYGDSNGSIDIIATGGVASTYSYLWGNSGITSSTQNNLTAGIYSVTVYDGATTSSCFSSADITVSTPLNLTTNSTITDAFCGGNNGKISVLASVAPSPYVYAWSNNETTAIISNLSAGNYDLTITYDVVCTKKQSFVVNGTPALSVTQSCTPASSNGASDGSSITIISGGTPSYLYLWNTLETTQNLANKPTGTYIVTVTDANNCTAIDSCSITTAIACNLSITTTAIDPSCPSGTDGVISTTTSGGQTPYNYLWSNNGAVSSAQQSGLAAGTYDITVFDNLNCNITTTASMIDPPDIIVFSTVTDVSCQGSDGSIVTNANNAITPYTYAWNNSETTANINGLVAGFYRLTVTFGSGCEREVDITVNNAPPLIASLSCSPESTNGANDGSATISPSGGVTPYTYLWNNGATTTGIANQAVGTVFGTVTDNAGCTATDNCAISAPTTCGFGPISTVTNVTCLGLSDGSISITLTNGTAPYAFAWSNSITTNSFQTGLDAGFYTLTITDATSCSETVTYQILGSALNLSSTIDSCQNGVGTATANVTGTQGGVSYLWNDGSTLATAKNLNAGTISVTVTETPNCTLVKSIDILSSPAIDTIIIVTDTIPCGASTGSAIANIVGGTTPFSYIWFNSNLSPLTTGTTTNSPSITGLEAGTIIIGVEDKYKCAGSNGNFVFNTLIISPIITNIQGTPAACFGESSGTGTLSATAINGTQPYVYQWHNIDDGTNYTGSNVSNATAGTYVVTVTDNQNPSCKGFQTTYIYSNSPEIFPFISVTNPTCNGIDDGAVATSTVGGIPPYIYNWSTGNTGTNIQNIGVGGYSLTITDALGCKDITSGLVTPAFRLTITKTGNMATCSGTSDGVLAVFTTGGTAPYAYEWSNLSSSSTITGLPVGIYVVTARDASGCIEKKPFPIVFLSDFTFDLFTVEDTCTQGKGSVEITNVVGGAAPYYYSIDGINYDSTAVFSNLKTDSILIYVKGNNGVCITKDTVFLENVVSNFNAGIAPVELSYCPEETITLTASGATTYNWNNNTETDSIYVIQPSETGYINVLMGLGTCEMLDSVLVTIENTSKCDFTLFIPANAFSPDGDGVNDIWVIEGIKQFTTNRVVILNRWGDAIFEITDYDNEANVWDGLSKGKELPTGTYFYVIYGDGAFYKRGYVQVVR